MSRANFLKLGKWNAICSSCRIEKPITDFHKHKGSATGYRPQCKLCKNLVAKKYREDNKEEIAEKNKVWVSNNKDKCNEATRRWRESNLDKDAKRTQDYRAIKLNAKPSWANDKYIGLWYKLAKVEEERTGRKVHVDHIIPLRGKLVCGLHCEYNLQLMFAEDNSAKGNKYESC